MDPTPHPLDLDRLFHEGDDQTWELEDWNWDPINILAEPKGASSPARRTCQALKRHKADHRLAEQQQQQQQQQHAAAAAAAAAMTAEIEAAANAAALAAGVPVLPGPDEGGEQKLVCQVPGCGRDLAGLKEYHQRYRICDVHIKLPQVMKDGRLQRFCQQCGRFHDLAAFDGNRKSCREQLQKHNARRRRRAALEQNMSLADSLLSAVDDKSDVGKLLQGLLSNPFQLQALRVLLGVQTHPALPQPAGQPAEHVPQLAAAGAVPADAAAAANAPTYEIARDIMDGSGAFAPAFESEHRVLRLSAKLFNVTPAELPPDVRGALTGWLGAAPAAMEGYMRPGCVLLNLHITLDSRAYEEALATGMHRLLGHLLSEASHAFWRSSAYLLQLLDTVAVVSRGSLVSLEVMGPQTLAAHKLPHNVSVSPLAVVAGEAASLTLTGSHISAADASLVVKGGGRLLHLAGVGATHSSSRGCCGSKPAGNAAAEGCAAAGCGHGQQQGEEAVGCSLAVPGGVPGQVLWVEVARGAFLSQPRPVLVVADPLLAQEVCALQALEGSVLSSSQVDALLLDLGLVLRHISSSSGASTAPAAAGIGHAAIAEKARRLIAFACDQGWVAVASAVLPLASACGTCAHDIVAAIHDSTAQDGLSLLHRAVRSGSPRLVAGLLAWGHDHAYTWRVASGGPGGVSPLHLAALLEGDSSVALMLLDAAAAEGEGGGSAFTDAAAADGVTPFQLAFQMGHYSLDRVLAGLGAVGPGLHSVLEQQLAPSGWQLLKAAAMDAAAADGAEMSAAAAACGGGCAAGCSGSGGQACGSGPAAVTAAAAPLKERVTACLDACLYCQSTLPPLLLSIKAKCAGCGERQPCVKDEPQPPTPPAAAPAAPAWAGARRGSQPVASAAAAAAAAAAVASLAGEGGGASCVHATGRVLSVTALCQTCHANRVLEVA
ncbi:hypothetical protein OEZ86_004365 [Tetradesmus obliquus]|nr:hypothetical protein OEZ86_004365 [Tetradesmus obliquus]